jgi:hypothetical protein
VGFEEYDDQPRLVKAGDYWHVYIGDDDRFAFDEEHNECKWIVVQRDVLAGDVEKMVPVWLCTKWTASQAQAWYVNAGGNVVALASDDGADLATDIAIDITKPFSFPAAWFAPDGKNRARGYVAPERILECHETQAAFMALVSLELRNILEAELDEN